MYYARPEYTEQELEDMSKARAEAIKSIKLKIDYVEDYVLISINAMMDSIMRESSMRYAKLLTQRGKGISLKLEGKDND